ncbi:MAG: hypothetical protein U0X76_00430 [Bacteroidia bacterium]
MKILIIRLSSIGDSAYFAGGALFEKADAGGGNSFSDEAGVY